MDLGFIKVGAYTPKIKISNVEFNVNSVINGILESDKKGVEILVFPKMCVSGSTVGDLLFTDTLINEVNKGLIKIAENTKGIKSLIFVGAPVKYNSMLFNASVVFNDGKILGIIPKAYLVDNDGNNESRYFSPSLIEPVKIDILGQETTMYKNIIFTEESKGICKVACEIGEDLYAPISPSTVHSISGANVIVNLSCENELVGAKENRELIIKSQSKKTACAYVYCNGGDGESTANGVYSGAKVICENGKLLKESNLFESGLITADIDVEYLNYVRSRKAKYHNDGKNGYIEIKYSCNREGLNLEREFSKTPFVPDNDNGDRADLIIKMQAEGLKKRIECTNSSYAVIGLSGGLDSTLAVISTVMGVKLAGKSSKEVLALTMPCFGTTNRTYENSIKLAKALGCTLKKVDIGKSVKRHLKDIGHSENEFDVCYENAQARERTKVLMDIANMKNGIVVGTGDLSEVALGWSTYNGDHMSNYGVNCSIPKTLIRYVIGSYAKKSKGKLKAVLQDILDTPVSPELLPSDKGEIKQKTEEIVGPYILHDFFLYLFIKYGYSPSKIVTIAEKTFKGDFTVKEIEKWANVFFKRFIVQQFKRSTSPDGVEIGAVSLNNFKMPSDVDYSLFVLEK